MPYYVYILKRKKDDKYYIGSTPDVSARLSFHNAGLQRSTKRRIPFELVLFEEYDSKEKTLKREKQIKSWKGRMAFKDYLRGSSSADGRPAFCGMVWRQGVVPIKSGSSRQKLSGSERSHFFIFLIISICFSHGFYQSVGMCPFVRLSICD